MSREAQAQERARAYFTSKSVLTPAEVREQIVAAFDALDAVLAAVPPDRARRRPLPDEWSIGEVVDHLVETAHRREHIAELEVHAVIRRVQLGRAA